jgi:hypothetical protein
MGKRTLRPTDGASGVGVDDHHLPVGHVTLAEDATRSGSASPSPAVGREAAIVAAGAFVVFLATLSAVPALTHDSLTYLLAIERGGADLFHPHHLAYNAVSRAWLDLWTALGVSADPLRVVASLNAVIGAAAAAMVWIILRTRAGMPRRAAAAGTAGATLSYGFWFYSVSVEVYALSLAALLAAFLALTSPRLDRRGLVVLGVACGVAVVAHQSNALFGLVVALELVRRRHGIRHAWREIVVVGLTAVTVAASAYAAVLAFVVKPRSADASRDWFTRYAQNDGYWHFEPGALVKAVFGFGRALLGGQYALGLEAVADRATSAFPGKSLADDAFLARHLPSWLVVVLVLTAAASALLLVATVVRGLWQRAHIAEPGRSLLRPLLIWLAVWAAFFLVWEPRNPEFHIPQVTMLWMVATVCCARTVSTAAGGPVAETGRAGPGQVRLVGVTLLTAAAVGIGMSTGVGTILPASDEGNDVYARRYTVLHAEVSEGDLILVDHPHLGLAYADRHTDARAVPVVSFELSVTMGERPPHPEPEDIADQVVRTLMAGDRVAVDEQLIRDPSNGRAASIGRSLEALLSPQWRHVEVADAMGWYIVDPVQP